MAGAYLGQNFLIDSKYKSFIVAKVLEYIKEEGYTTGMEIGPGKGAITKKLDGLFQKIILFEKDETFRDILESIVIDRGEIIWGDILEANFDNVFLGLDLNKILIIGNLPYYITSPIFRLLFEKNSFFKRGIFMIQKEVGDKIKFDAPKKSFLWWILNYQYEVKYLKTVPAKAFKPAPKVQSCLVEFRKKEMENINYSKMIELLDKISKYKRKTIGKSLKMAGYDIDTLDTISKLRLENLGWDEMKEILSKI